MSTYRHPISVGHDRPLRKSTESNDYHHIPRGYSVDHHGPTAFVVHCAACNLRLVLDSRGNAHRRAKTHALGCHGNAGVSPISADADIESDSDDLDAHPDDLDPRRVDLTGSDVTVTYQSVQGGSGCQRRSVSVDRMLPAEDATDWRGFEATAENGVTLRVVASSDDPAVQVVAQNGRRVIGSLDSIRPKRTMTGTTVATDGGNP